MMMIAITAALKSGNTTVFNVVDSSGAAVNLTALGVTVVTASVCGPLIKSGFVSIDSTTDDVTFLNDTISVKFGMLDLAPAQLPYSPKVSYVTAADSDPEVIVGQGYRTEIKLKVIC
jgi:hypothetical protein